MFDHAGYRVHQVELGQDFVLAIFHVDENGWAFVAQNVRDALDGRVAWQLRQRFASLALDLLELPAATRAARAL